MKLVYKHENRAILFSAKNILEMNAIQAHVKNEHGNTMGPEFGLPNVMLELWVLDDADYDRARTVLEKQFINPPAGEPWVCSQCGERNEGNFGACWNCQAPRSEKLD